MSLFEDETGVKLIIIIIIIIIQESDDDGSLIIIIIIIINMIILSFCGLFLFNVHFIQIRLINSYSI